MVRRESEPGRQLPVDEVQEALGTRGLVILVFVMRLLSREAQDAMRGSTAENNNGIRRVTRG